MQWCAASPGEPLESFESAHGDWPIVDAMFKPNGAALAAFVGWAETHPQAARELVEEPRGLAWVGFHLFRADWAAAEGQSPEPAPSPVDPAAPPEAK